MMEDTLRDLFRGYHKPTQEEIDKIWNEGVITLDTNILLFFYDVQEATAAEHLDALSKRQERLWIPYQVAEEFHRNTHKQRARQTEAHQQRINRITTFKNELGNFQTQSRLKATAAQAESVKALDAYIEELTGELNFIKEATSTRNPDTILDRVTELFDGHIGPKPGKQQLDSLFKEGAKRFAEEIPPGYMDIKDKPGNRKYGDYVLWKQLMEHAAQEKKDVIFVTEDGKEDWWMKLHPAIPRPELIQEFREETGQDILIVKSANFYHRLFQETSDASRQAEVLAAQQDMEAVVEEAHRTNLDAALRGWKQALGQRPSKSTTADVGTFNWPARASWVEEINKELRAQDIAMRKVLREQLAATAAEVEFLSLKRNELEYQLAASPLSSDREHLRVELDETGSRLADAHMRLSMLHAQLTTLDGESDDD